MQLPIQQNNWNFTCWAHHSYWKDIRKFWFAMAWSNQHRFAYRKIKSPPEKPCIFLIHTGQWLGQKQIICETRIYIAIEHSFAREQRYYTGSVLFQRRDDDTQLKKKDKRSPTSWSRHSNFQTLSPRSSISFHHLKPTRIRPLTFLTTQKSRAARRTVTTKMMTKLLIKRAERM